MTIERLEHGVLCKLCQAEQTSSPTREHYDGLRVSRFLVRYFCTFVQLKYLISWESVRQRLPRLLSSNQPRYHSILTTSPHLDSAVLRPFCQPVCNRHLTFRPNIILLSVTIGIINNSAPTPSLPSLPFTI